ncbi:MAG: HD domain-containing protein [Nitrospirota bacterium]
MAFYDPVHGLSLISNSEQGLQSLWQDPDKYHLNSIFSICDTLEFKRLHFLRQAGFCFQSYPSATHTRFGHSIGTCHLGRAALDQVDIRITNKNRIKLGEWLREIQTNSGKKDLRDEFLVALLLHDVGHFPFSHVLESNPHLKNAGFPHHEEIAVDMILNNQRNKIVKAYNDALDSELISHIGALRLFKILNHMQDSGQIDSNVLAYLICHERQRELADIINDPPLVEKLNLLCNLVSGVVDIDRLDHYIRDLYFTGTGLSVFNVFKLLNAIYLDETNGKVYVDQDALPQAFNLLHSKEHLRRYIFEDPKNMAFNAMLNYCVSSYVKAQELGELTCKYGTPRPIEVLLTLTDDQLLSELELVLKPASISKMVQLIRIGCPYELMECLKVAALHDGQTLAQRAEYLSSNLAISFLENTLPSTLFLLQDTKGKVSLFSMDELFYVNNTGTEFSIREAAGFQYLIRHLSAESENQELRCWVFSKPGKSEADINDLKEKLTVL